MTGPLDEDLNSARYGTIDKGIEVLLLGPTV